MGYWVFYKYSSVQHQYNTNIYLLLEEQQADNIVFITAGFPVVFYTVLAK